MADNLVSDEFIAEHAWLVAEFLRVRDKLDGANGLGVNNSHYTLSFDAPPTPPSSPIFPVIGVYFAKLSADWSPTNRGNFITANPCAGDGTSAATNTLNLALAMPVASLHPQSCYLKSGDVIGYMPFVSKLSSGTNTIHGLAQSWDQTGTIAVDCITDGGAAGSAGTQCTFTYTVKKKGTATVLGTAIPLENKSQRIVTMTAGTKGLAYYDDTGTLILYSVNETPATTTTSCP